jgi:LysR family nitrogen assimilation transcriptional regulator
LRTDVEAVALQNGITLNVCLEVDAGYQLIRQVMQGRGYSILARSAVIPEINEGWLVAIPMRSPRFTRRVCLAEWQDRRSAFLLGRVRAVIRKVVRELLDSGKWPGVFIPSRSEDA